MRSLDIMRYIRPLLAERNHAKIQMFFNADLAKLFGYQKIAILFKHETGPNLYCIIAEELEELVKT